MKKFVILFYIVLLGFATIITLWYFKYYQPFQNIRNAESRKVYRVPHLKKTTSKKKVALHNRSVQTPSNNQDKQKEITYDLLPEYTDTDEPIANTINQETTTPSKTLESRDTETFDAEAWESFLESELQALYAEIDEKYPELVGIASLTEEEVHTLFPTLEARVAISERASQAHDEFMGRFVEIFSQMPQNRQVMAISHAREVVAKNWGEEFADKVIDLMLTDLDIPPP